VEDLRLGGCGCEGAAGFLVADFAGLVKSTILIGSSTFTPVNGFEGDRHSSLGSSISPSLSSSSSLCSFPLQSLSLSSACRPGRPGTAYETVCFAILLGVARTGLLSPSSPLGANNKLCSRDFDEVPSKLGSVKESTCSSLNTRWRRAEELCSLAWPEVVPVAFRGDDDVFSFEGAFVDTLLSDTSESAAQSLSCVSGVLFLALFCDDASLAMLC